MLFKPWLFRYDRLFPPNSVMIWFQKEAEAGMRAKSQEFLAEGGKLYVDAAE